MLCLYSRLGIDRDTGSDLNKYIHTEADRANNGLTERLLKNVMLCLTGYRMHRTV